MKKILAVLIVVGVVYVGVQYYMDFYLQKKLNITGDTIVVVEKGGSLSGFANSLKNQGIIDQPSLWVRIGRFKGYGNKIKYGEYMLKPTDTHGSLLEKIVKGDIHKYEITFVEGDNRYKFARQIEEKALGSAAEFLALTSDQDLIVKYLGEPHSSLEGYLFPDTYHFSKNDGVKTIINSMVNKFFQETKGLDFNKNKMSRHQTITLASIIEKETGAPFERPLISSVFHNRLDKKMRLQTDPTIIYGLIVKTGQDVTNIRKQDILTPTEYNTYVISGLPPGPIASPGIEAIKAAIDPQPSEYLYFVSQNDGTHIFSVDYKSHLRGVKKFQLDPKMRKGKSWRDLGNKKQKKAK